MAKGTKMVGQTAPEKIVWSATLLTVLALAPVAWWQRDLRVLALALLIPICIHFGSPHE